MHKSEYAVLMLFKKNPQKEFSTTEIAEEVYKEEFYEIDTSLKRSINDKGTILKAKREKGKMHRRLLHHLNKLVNDEILSVIKVTGKGEKHFKLSLDAGEEFVIGNQKKKLVISKPAMPAMPIEGYEQTKVIKKYEESTWVDRLNALLIECSKFRSIKEIYGFISTAFSAVNDVVGLNDFEFIIQNNSANAVEDLLLKLNEDCADYGKTISITLDLTNVKEEKKVMDFLKTAQKINPSNINIIFDVRTGEMTRNKGIVTKAIDYFSKAGIQLNIKNQDIHEAPYMIGRAGPYTFSPKEWKRYDRVFRKDSYCIACAQSSIAVDVSGFLLDNKSLNEFRALIMNVAKALLSANSMMKRKSAEYFRDLIKINHPYLKEFFMISKNYIRLWNYGWKDPRMDPETVIELIKSTKEEINEFAQAQQTISRSCGVPTRFKIAYGPAFKEFDREFSEEKFQKIQIKKLEDLYSEEIKQMLSAKEHIFGIFDGGDRQRFFRSGEITLEGIWRELRVILNSYQFPLFCYDFGRITGGEIKLTKFM